MFESLIMKLTLILRKLNLNEFKALVKKYDIDNDLIYCENMSFFPERPDKLNVKTIDVNQDELGEVSRKCFNDTIHFGHQVFNNRRFISWLTFKNRTYWYYAKFKLFHSYKEISLKAIKVNYLLKKHQNENINEIILYYDTELIRYLLIENKVLRIIKKSNNKVGNYLNKINYVLIFLIRALLGFFQIPILLTGKKHVIIVNPLNKQFIVDLSNGQLKKGDILIEYLLELSYNDDEFLFLSEVNPPSVKDSKRIGFKENLFYLRYWKKTVHFELFTFLNLFNPFIFLELIRFNNYLKHIQFTLSPYIKSSEDKLIFEILKSTRNLLILGYFREKAASLFFKFSKYSSIGGEDEHTIKIKPLLTIAKEKGIRTYGIQHGGISNQNINYMFNLKDINYQPWPDYTIVRGEYSYNTLVKHSNYPKDQVIVLGHCRTDCIPILKKLKKRDVINNLSNEKPLILFASQPFPEGEKALRMQLAEDFLKLTKELPDLQFIIKPHPNEKDLKFYKEIATQLNTNNFSILQSDLYRLLAISDIVVTCYSTVGTEAIYFNKHLIVMDYYNIDAQGYLKDKVAFKTTNYDELKETVRNILNGKLKIDDEYKEKYTKNRAYEIDGKTTERYYSFIKSLMN